MSELEYYPSFTSYSDNHGILRENLTRDSLFMGVPTGVTVRPGDIVEMDLWATHPRDKQMRIHAWVSDKTRTSLGRSQVLDSGEKASFTWGVDESQVMASCTIGFYLFTVDPDYTRSSRDHDQHLEATYRVDPPADY